jgi:hypothetical protein
MIEIFVVGSDCPGRQSLAYTGAFTANRREISQSSPHERMKNS